MAEIAAREHGFELGVDAVLPGASARTALERGDAHHAAPPPLLGEHNDEVLAGELGLSEAELMALRADGIVGEVPR